MPENIKYICECCGKEHEEWPSLTYSDLTVSISVAEVKPNYRKKGIGKLLLEEIIKKYESQNIYALYLYCAPESSQRIWKKMGFKYFPNNSTNDRSDKIEMYNIIKPYLKSRKSKSQNEIIEIWNEEPHRTNDENPTWVFNLKYKKKTKILDKPIVHFGDFDWRIRWRKGKEIYKDCKYKYFDIYNEEFSCMIIKKL
jgi:predicted acetyltransferase